MEQQPPPIDARLLGDCHVLGTLARSTLLLHRNAALPWFILVPHTALADVLDLPGPLLPEVLADCAAVSAFIKEELGYDKVNFAGLGNVVPQMHLHVIGRREGDACWPRPVWGNLPPGGDYSRALLAQWRDRLAASAGLVAAGEGFP